MTEENRKIVAESLGCLRDEAYIRGKQESAELVAELVEALQGAIEYMEVSLKEETHLYKGFEDCSDIAIIEEDLAKARAAIAKATGE